MLAGLALPGTAFCRNGQFLAGKRAISLVNLHTGEELQNLTYWADGSYLPDALKRCNWLLRDHRTDDVHRIDPKLFDLVHAIRNRLCSSAPVQIVSGYRSPATNQQLRSASKGVAKHSLHMRGLACDIRLPKRGTSEVWRAARGMKRGGVGLYTRSNFVHVDIGRVRYWGS